MMLEDNLFTQILLLDTNINNYLLINLQNIYINAYLMQNTTCYKKKNNKIHIRFYYHLKILFNLNYAIHISLKAQRITSYASHGTHINTYINTTTFTADII